MTMITPDEVMPADTLIDYGNGHVGALMFHFAAEGQSYDDIARNAGYETLGFLMDHDPSDEAAALCAEYHETGNPTVLIRWTPAIPDGWQLGAKQDTEDGPAVLFIRSM
jgi:hypothetical protein